MRLAPHTLVLLAGLLPAVVHGAAPPVDAVRQEVVKALESRAKAPSWCPPLPDVAVDPLDPPPPGRRRSTTVRVTNRAAKNAAFSRIDQAAKKAADAATMRAEERARDAASEKRTKDIVKDREHKALEEKD